MEVIICFERSNKYFSKFIDILRQTPQVRIKHIKSIVSHSSYYAYILKKVCSINKILREINPNVYLAEPHFDITKSNDVFTALKRCDRIEIELKKDFFLVRWKK